MSDLDLGSDKSLEDFGSALLSRKSEQRKKARKIRRRAELPMKLLTGALAVNNVFQNATKRRIQEIENTSALDLINSKVEAPVYQQAATFVQPLLGFTGTVEEFKKDGERYNAFKSAVTPSIDPYIQASQAANLFGYANHQSFINNNGKAYNHMLDVGTDALLEKLLTDNNYQKIVDAMQSITPEEQSEEELVKSIMGLDLSGEGLNIFKTQKYLNDANRYKSQGSLKNVVDNVKSALNAMGILNEEQGGINLFKQKDFDDNRLIGGALSDVIDSVNFETTIKTSTQDFITNYKDSPERFLNSVTAQDVKTTDQLIQNLASQAAKGGRKNRSYDPTGAYNFYDGTELFRLLEKIEDNEPSNYQELMRNGTALSNLIQEKPELGAFIYEQDLLVKLRDEVKSGQLEQKDFTKELTKRLEAFRTKIAGDSNYATRYAVLKLLKSGEGRPLTENFSQRKTYLGTSDFLYDHDKALESFEKFMTSTVQYDQKTDTFSFSDQYLNDNADNPEKMREAIVTFVRRTYLSENFNQAEEEVINFLTDVNASKYYKGASPDVIKNAIIQKQLIN